MSNSNVKSNGVGCLTVIGIVFLVLKLLAIEPVAHWSWIWVLCPFWIPFILCLFVAGGGGGFAFILGSRR